MIKTIFHILCLALPLSIFSQNIYYVNQFSTGNSSGLSWENAFDNLQSALVVANAGDSIWVAKGIYLPTEQNDRNQAFGLKSGVKIYGGFIGGESQLDARNSVLNITILSGNIGDAQLKSDNSLHVIKAEGVDSGALLDGFIIEDGYANDDYGGGIYITEGNNPYSNPNIFNCIFRNNYATWGGGAYLYGDFINPSFRNCLFQSNRAFEKGGAMFHAAHNTGIDTFLLKDCQFKENRVVSIGEGGALYFEYMYNYVVLLKNCVFERDSAISGGAIASLPTFNATFIIDSCVFRNNWATTGACFNYSGFFMDSGNSVTIKTQGSTFEKNKAQSFNGSGFYIAVSNNAGVDFSMEQSLVNDNLGIFIRIEVDKNSISSVEIQHSVFTSNSSGVFFVRLNADDVFNRSNTSFVNCLFAHNSKVLGTRSISHNNFANTKIQHCTFYKNKSLCLLKNTFNSYNLGVDTFYNKLLVENSVLWEPDMGLSSILVNDNPDLPQYVPHGKDIEVRHSYLSSFALDTNILVQGKFHEGMIFKKYPEFMDTLAEDYRLKPCSPLVNKGDNNVPILLQLPTDLNGALRIAKDTVDMGAYEQQEPCISNIHSTAFSQQLILHPNPSFDGYFCFYMPDFLTNIEDIQLFNAFGQLVYESNINHENGNSICCYTPNLGNGWYRVVAKFPEGVLSGVWIKTGDF